METAAKALFAIACLLLAGGAYELLTTIGNVQVNGDRYFFPAIATFAAAGVAQMIWGERPGA